MSSSSNIIIVQHIKTCKIEVLDNNMIVIIIFCTTLNTIPMIEDCIRCINKGRLIDIKIAGFIKHWRQKGRIEIRSSRYSYQ